MCPLLPVHGLTGLGLMETQLVVRSRTGQFIGLLRFSWEDVVERPEEVVAAVREALLRAGSGW